MSLAAPPPLPPPPLALRSSLPQEAGKLIGDIQDKVKKQAEAEEKLAKAKAAAERARRSSWLPQTWWGRR